ncbi:putative inactive tyrosine-protein kinase Wsck isoform X2 [Anabrus simplex]|uniref:putative inactive tyrosine-protein kinase Wsck isoform X2 n=1 Tax=Anabrus simplex TaxID=316456 RepID=UPI0035A2F92F
MGTVKINYKLHLLTRPSYKSRGLIHVLASIFPCERNLQLELQDLPEHLELQDHPEQPLRDRFAGLQNSQGCFCGDTHSDLDGVCDQFCSGNTSQMCGGSVSKSVYHVGKPVSDVPAFLQLLNATNTSLEIAWNLPVPSKVLITNYTVTAKYVETYSLPNLVPLLKWIYPKTTTKAVLLNLHPGTRYDVVVAVVSPTGVLGQKSATYWTEIGEPPTPAVPEIISYSAGRMVVRLSSSVNDNGPITAYRIIVVYDEGLDSFNPEKLTSYHESTQKGLLYYIAAEIHPEDLNNTFVVGDDQEYGNYTNPRLPDARVHVGLGIVSVKDGVMKVAYSKIEDVLVLDVGPPSDVVTPSSTTLVVGLSVAIGVFGFLLLLSIAVYFVLLRHLGRRQRIPDHQELSLEGPMIEVDTSSYVHNGYVPDEEDEWTDHYEKLKQRVWNIPRNFLDVKSERLGKGKYGNVMKGTVQQRGFPIPVAIYVIADGELAPVDKKSMLQDLNTLIQVGSCKNLVSLIGTCETPDTLFIVIDHQPATLKDVLLASRCLDPSSLNQHQFCSLSETQVLETAVGIARGMEFLARRKIVHKQLAARNVMMVDGVVPKVTSFGIAQYNTGSMIPDYTRWTAQEIFRSRHFVSKSDVWSFGCLLWEITALGGTPYVDVNSSDLPTRVTQGLRLPQIQLVGDDLYQLMIQCWQVDLDERPSFQEIVHILENMLDESAIHINFAVYTGFHYEQYAPELERL